MIKAAAFIEDVSRGRDRIPPWVLSSGAEEFLRAEVHDAVAAALGDDADLVTFDWSSLAEDGGVAALLDELRTSSLFGGSKLVRVVRSAKLLTEHAALLKSFAADEVPGAAVIFEDEALVKKRAKKLPAAAKALVDAGGVVVDCGTLYATPFGYDRPAWDSDLSRWVQARARLRGKSISLQAAYHLHSRDSSGLRGIAAQLDKICLALDEAEVITEEDVERHVGDDHGATVFEVVDRFAANEANALAVALERLFRGGIKNANGARSLDPTEITMRLTSLIGSRLRELGRIFELRRQGSDMDEAMATVIGAGRKFLFGKIRAQLAARAPRELGDVVLGLAELDIGLKTGAGTPRDLLTEFLIRFSGARSRTAR